MKSLINKTEMKIVSATVNKEAPRKKSEIEPAVVEEVKAEGDEIKPVVEQAP